MSQAQFYGWRIVAACAVLVTISWSLGIYGVGVYIYALAESRGFSIGALSAAVTATYIMGALMMVIVGRTVARRGARLVVTLGALAMAAGVALIPWCQHLWQVYAAFLLLGLGMACLSTTTVGATLAPWFERFQGRAISLTMLGASIGGMISTPLLMAGIRFWGFQATALCAAIITVATLVPLALYVLKRRPQDMGQLPDGAPPAAPDSPPPPSVVWGLKEAAATRHFRSNAIAFSLVLMVQVGFMSHHVSIAMPILGAQGAATAVFCTAVAAFIGRLLLTRYADQINMRTVGAGLFLMAAASLTGMALLPGAWALMATSICYGLTIGNITTLAPMITRREFGAASYGVVSGLAATIVQLAMSLGPTLYGVLRDLFGTYTPGLLLCGVLNTGAALVLVWGGKRALTAPPQKTL